MSKQCYIYVETANVIGVVNEGETGYYKTDILECNKIKTPSEAREFVKELNQKLGLSEKEAAIMQAKSMGGWD
jgi:hypothetical protein